MTKNTKIKVDLFEFLGKISKFDIHYLEKLSFEEKKQLAPIVLMRWLSGTSDKEQIKNINENLNSYVFPLYKEPDLLFKLMGACSTGKNSRYSWIKPYKSNKNSSLALEIIMRYYKIIKNEAEQIITIFNKDDIIEMANELGEDDSVIKKLQKE